MVLDWVRMKSWVLNWATPKGRTEHKGRRRSGGTTELRDEFKIHICELSLRFTSEG